jgi:predicted DNA-binding transcriptional regulator
MKNQKLDAVHVWKEMEDVLVPRLRPSAGERAVYSHLLRHSRLEGKRQLRFSIPWLARGTCLSAKAVKRAVRRLIARGVLRLIERGQAGHVVEVRLPDEIRALRAKKRAGDGAARRVSTSDLEKVDFQATRTVRAAIYAREGGLCFYCLRRLTPLVRSIDHVLPCVRKGRNSYRNLVACCADCNSQKSDRRAEDYLRWLYREGRLTSGELTARLRTLKSLAAGKLRPRLPDRVTTLSGRSQVKCRTVRPSAGNR